MSDIFLSYAREDLERVRPLAEALQAQGWSVWWDRSIAVGQTFDEVIEQELRACRAVVVVWTGASVRSDWVRDEAHEGRERKILFPVRLDDVRPPMGYRRLQAADFTAWDGSVAGPALRAFVADLEVALGPPGGADERIEGEDSTRAEPRETAAPELGTSADTPNPDPAVHDPLVVPAEKADPQSPLRWRWLSAVGLVALGAVVWWVWGGGSGSGAVDVPGERPPSATGQAIEYVAIPAGRFQMGAVPGDESADDDEKPRHEVELSKGFLMSRTEITVGAYRQYVEAAGLQMPEAPSFNSGWGKADHPVVNVSWENAKGYCEWVGGRLPSEAEWEYAARGGKSGLLYPHGNELTERDAKYGSSGGTAEVGRYSPNEYGLYDMVGNVWEWCADWYGGEYYQSSPRQDPQGQSAGEYRVLRGGSWVNYRWVLRVSLRDRFRPDDWFNNIGFRCVREDNP